MGGLFEEIHLHVPAVLHVTLQSLCIRSRQLNILFHVCAQLRVYYSEVLTGVQSPTQYCTRSYFKVLAAAVQRNSTCAGHPHACWLACKCSACGEPLRGDCTCKVLCGCVPNVPGLGGLIGRSELTTAKSLHDALTDRGLETLSHACGWML